MARRGEFDLITLYTMKPRFQALLRPLVGRLARAGVTANQVTISAAFGSVIVGVAVGLAADATPAFLLLPVWLAARMALNAIDGMLAREFAQQSTLGAYLNELGDAVSDAALYAPFAFIAPFGALPTAIVIALAVLTEFAGVLGPSVGASRRYEGPLGKSDRALLFGALGCWIGIGGARPEWLALLMPVTAVLLMLTVANRIRAGIREASVGTT